MRWKRRAVTAEAEAERWKAEHQWACVLIAEMHAAAWGGEVRGPARGVVEDVADLYARVGT